MKLSQNCVAAFAASILLLASPTIAAGQEIPGTPPTAKSTTTPRKHIVLLSMGGTIAAIADDRMNLTHYGSKDKPLMAPAQWLHDLPELEQVADIRVEDFRAPTGASDDFKDIAKVAHRLQQLAHDPAVDGLVVTHGTNTMAEVAYYLNLVVDTEKPIVLTGSQRPWSGISGDGPLNLLDAVRVAADPGARGMGVLQVMNQNINTARDVTKTNTYRVQAFKGVDVGPIGLADSDNIRFYHAPTRLHTSASIFRGIELDTLPPVEVFYAYTNAPGWAIDSAIEHKVRGIIMDGYGAGVINGDELAAIKRAQAKGVVVVMTSRVGGGRVQESKERSGTHTVTGDNLPPEKARLLLQLALTRTDDPSLIQDFFDDY